MYSDVLGSLTIRFHYFWKMFVCVRHKFYGHARAKINVQDCTEQKLMFTANETLHLVSLSINQCLLDFSAYISRDGAAVTPFLKFLGPTDLDICCVEQHKSLCTRYLLEDRTFIYFICAQYPRGAVMMFFPQLLW